MRTSVSEAIIKSIKICYKDELRKQQTGTGSSVVKLLSEKKRGRTLLLGDELDKKLQLYLRRIREDGGPVTAGIAIAAARGLLMAEHKNRLVENGGHIKLNRHWAYGFFRRMGFVQRKPTTAKSKFSVENFAAKKKEFLDELVTPVEMEEIPPELILNWDQTGIRLVPSSSWTMEKKGVKRVKMVGQNDKRQITAVFCGSLQGDFLPVQVIYKGKTTRCHPHFEFPPGWHVTHSPNHWSTETTMLQYVENIIARALREFCTRYVLHDYNTWRNYHGQF